MTLSIILVAGGFILGLVLYHLINRKRQKQIVTKNSIVLMERVRQVLKLVTVEGDFSDGIDHFSKP